MPIPLPQRFCAKVILPLVILSFSAAIPAAGIKGSDYKDHSNLLVVRDADGRERPVTTAADWAERRKHILAGMQEATGLLPNRTNLPHFDMQVSEEFETDKYKRLTITFVVEQGDRLSAYLYLPKGNAEKHSRPGVVALHSTGDLGKKIVDGQGPMPNRAYAQELAERGYVVIAPDYCSFGGYNPDLAKLGYVSGTIKGIFNHMRCVDLLQSLDAVDPQRIAAIGHSLGGHNAIFLGVFDPRVKVIVSSCGWTPFHDYYGGKIEGWTSERYMPLLKTRYNLDPDRVPFDFYELVAALAPRPFFSNSPLNDANFDYRGVEKAVAKAKVIYDLLGDADSLQVRYPDSEHDFPNTERHESYRFIDKALDYKAPE